MQSKIHSGSLRGSRIQAQYGRENPVGLLAWNAEFFRLTIYARMTVYGHSAQVLGRHPQCQLLANRQIDHRRRHGRLSSAVLHCRAGGRQISDGIRNRHAENAGHDRACVRQRGDALLYSRAPATLGFSPKSVGRCVDGLRYFDHSTLVTRGIAMSPLSIFVVAAIFAFIVDFVKIPVFTRLGMA